MRTYLLAVCLILVNFKLVAQPQAINYQGLARNYQGIPLVNHNISLRLSILDSSVTGPVIYIETQSIITNSSGLFNIGIGNGTPLSGTFSAISWEKGDKLLKVEMDTAGGSNFQLMGTTQFLSVPYSMYSMYSGPKGVNIGDMQYWNGISWVTLPVGPDGYGLALCNGIPTWGGCQISLTTNIASSVAFTTAISGGSITNFNGLDIILSGICYGTSPNPSFNGKKTIDGSSSGNFTSNLNGLIPNTTYFVRAFALTSFGTKYGNQISFTTSHLPSIGSLFQGGILAYILQPGDYGYDSAIPHGIIAATNDQSSSTNWWNGTFVTTSATELTFGSGNLNTNKIVAIGGSANYAASLCFDLILNGYSDWYLPSVYELIALQNIGLGAPAPNTNAGGFADAYYWSSSETDISNAFHVNLGSNGGFGTTSKSDVYHVRAIRYF